MVRYNWLYLSNTNMLSFAGAIGHDDLNREFTQQEIQLEDGDTVYLASDGYQDQLGGEKYTKFMTRTFRSLLLRINADAMDVQRTALIAELETWRGTTPQTDDICVMCVRV